MPVRTSSAVWEGNLKEGKGQLTVGNGAYRGPYSFASRFENGQGTNPEELLGAAHAGCFSMALANMLAQAGHAPRRISTQGRVHLEKGEKGFGISRIELVTEADVPGLDEKTFLHHAEEAKRNCPVSRALTGVEIVVQATLRS